MQARDEGLEAAALGLRATVTSTSSRRAQIVVRVPPRIAAPAAKARATAGSPTP